MTTEPGDPSGHESAPSPERLAVLLRLPPDLVAAADRLAEKQQVSRSAVLLAALQHSLPRSDDWLPSVRDGRSQRWTSKRRD